MIKNIILISLILSLVLIGCQKAEEPKVEPEVTETEEEITTDISIESDVSEIDSLDDDLNLGDLEDIESDLDEINW